MKTVTVLLTKYSDCISGIIYYIGGRGYTHSSLALEGEENFYSFNYHGFCIETLDKHKRRGVDKYLIYELQISEENYNRIKERIEEIRDNREEYSYTRIGLALAVFKIPFKRNKRYFCSQFVAELLKECGDIPLRRNTNTYLPNHFYSELKDAYYLKSSYQNAL